MPNRSATNWWITLQFQLAKPIPTAPGNSCTAPFSTACCASPRAGGGNSDRGMYFIWDLPQLNVRPYSRTGLLRYKNHSQNPLSDPFHHSRVGRNPEVAGPVRSYNLAFTYPCQGGELPDCSKIRAAGPPSPKAAAHLPMVCGSRSSASATAEAVHPWASNQTACHLLSLPKGPLPRRWRQYHPPVHILHTHFPLLKQPLYPPHTHHQPLSPAKANPLFPTNLPHLSAHFTLALVQ